MSEPDEWDRLWNEMLGRHPEMAKGWESPDPRNDRPEDDLARHLVSFREVSQRARNRSSL